MGYHSPSFLDTKKEHDNWHKGLYKGLKIHNPRKLVKSMLIYDKGWRQWYHDDNHYHDFALLGSYGLKALTIIAGFTAISVLGL